MDFSETEWLKKCQTFWHEQSWFFAECKTILAVSGGKDSIFLFHLFRKLNFPFSVAHVNYKLRGKDSDEDERFVMNLCIQYAVPFFLKIDDLNAAKQGSANIQIAARTSRYIFFHNLLNRLNYNFIATAHHAKDNLETVIINLGRGTGPKGLMGIPIQNQKVLRPILPLAPAYIEEWLIQNKFSWREDKSNTSDEYLRNKIRHHAIPSLEEAIPNIYESMTHTQGILSENINFIHAEVLGYKSKMRESAEGFLNIELLKDHPYGAFILYSILKKDGINRAQCDTLFRLIGSRASKVVKSASFQFLLKGAQLWKRALHQSKQTEVYIEELGSVPTLLGTLELSKSELPDIYPKDKNIAFFDLDKIIFPMEFRTWKKGDTFSPLGMEGNRKKLQNFFSDIKLTIHQKEETPLLISKGEITWVIGHRSSHDFRLTDKTQNILKAIWKPIK